LDCRATVIEVASLNGVDLEGDSGGIGDQADVPRVRRHHGVASPYGPSTTETSTTSL
jgi:hypothetical protein